MSIRLPKTADPSYRAWRGFGLRVFFGLCLTWGGLAASVASSDPLPAQFVPSGALSETNGGVGMARLPDGRVLVCSVSSAQVYDVSGAQWGPALPMADQHAEAAVVGLSDGRVLVAGTTWASGNHASAEVYDPALGFFAPTGAMQIPRYGAKGVRLPNGEVLVVGGRRPGSVTTPLAQSEIYSPVTRQFRTTGSMSVGRVAHTLTLLANGKVLVVGGAGSTNAILRTAEIYDPATGQWRPTGSMMDVRMQHAAALLPNGRVLVTGGWINVYASFRATDAAEVFDPVSGQFASAFPMMQTRMDHAMTVLPDGLVLVAAGQDDFGQFLTTAEVFNPATGYFSAISARLMQGRRRLAGLSLGDGRALFAGGDNAAGYVATAELFTPDRIFAATYEN